MVLQRWQTVYLFIATVMLGLSTFLPVFDVTQSDGMIKGLSLPAMASGAMPELAPAFLYFILTGLSTILSIIAIAKFKRLKMQKTLCSVVMLLIIAAYVVIGLAYHYISADYMLSWSLMSLAPAFALICVLLAKMRIAHDYKLLHDADRLR